MEIPANINELLLKTYSIDYLLKCRVDEVSESILKLSPLSGKVDMFQAYDPVILLYNDDNDLQVCPADVASINSSMGQVTLNRPQKEVGDDRRIFERYPVSLAVSARRKYSSKRLSLVAKNISMFGMCVISESELDEEEFIDIDLITDRSMIYFSGKIIWKKMLGKGFEYGLQLTHFDVATKSIFESYLVSQKAEYSKMMSKAR